MNGKTCEPMRVTARPQVPSTGIAKLSDFYASVTLQLLDPDSKYSQLKVATDYIFVMDNSGSMGGAKIQDVKQAISFVVDKTTSEDRIGLVYFNSTAGVLSELVEMTEEKKDLVRNKACSLSANGGTNIFDGLKCGLSMLERRSGPKKPSCVFLLTDGQDRGQEDGQVELAKKIKGEGASLFIFGFGGDHDSVHLERLSKSSHSLFTFLDTKDLSTEACVNQAFGGAIGLQQSYSVKNVRLSIVVITDGVQIKETMTGFYQISENVPKTYSTTVYPDLYNGEKRGVLLRLDVPSVSSSVRKYKLFRAFATYDDFDGTEKTTAPFICSIERTDLSPKKLMTNIGVDAELNRFKFIHGIQGAVSAADRNNFSEAQISVDKTAEQIKESISFAKKTQQSVKLLEGLDSFATTKAFSQREYSSGGRAIVCHSLFQWNTQRCIYNKGKEKGFYQSANSAFLQFSARGEHYKQERSICSTKTATVIPCSICGVTFLKNGFPHHFKSCSKKIQGEGVDSWPIPTYASHLEDIKLFAKRHNLKGNFEVNHNRRKSDILGEILQQLPTNATAKSLDRSGSWEVYRQADSKPRRRVNSSPCLNSGRVSQSKKVANKKVSKTWLGPDKFTSRTAAPHFKQRKPSTEIDGPELVTVTSTQNSSIEPSNAVLVDKEDDFLFREA